MEVVTGEICLPLWEYDKDITQVYTLEPVWNMP